MRKFSDLDAEFKTLAKEMYKVKSDTKEMQVEIKRFREDIADRMNALEKLIHRLESHYDGLVSDLKALKLHYKSLDDRDDELDKRILALDKRLKLIQEILDGMPKDLRLQLKRLHEFLDEENPLIGELRKLIHAKIDLLTGDISKLEALILKNKDDIRKDALYIREQLGLIDDRHKVYVRDNDAVILDIRDKLKIRVHDDGLRGKIDELHALLDGLDSRIKKNKLTIKEYDERILAFRPLIAELDDHYKGLAKTVKANSFEIDVLRKDQDVIKVDVTKQKAEVKRVSADLLDLRRMLDKWIEELKRDLESTDIRVKGNVREIEALKAALEELRDKIRGLGELSQNSLVKVKEVVLNEVTNKFDSWADVLLRQRLDSLRKEFDGFRITSWEVLAKLYGVFRCYTILIYGSPDGEASKEIPMAMGVFRLIGVFNGRPLYKKDGGEMYLYYLSGAWMDADDHLWSMLPDLRKGWEFQTMSNKRHHEADWRKDDRTLTCEPLRDVDNITHLLLKASRGKDTKELEEVVAAGKLLKADQVVDTCLENYDPNHRRGSLEYHSSSKTKELSRASYRSLRRSRSRSRSRSSSSDRVKKSVSSYSHSYKSSPSTTTSMRSTSIREESHHGTNILRTPSYTKEEVKLAKKVRTFSSSSSD